MSWIEDHNQDWLHLEITNKRGNFDNSGESIALLGGDNVGELRNVPTRENTINLSFQY
jgi:hypothetical protein